MEEIRIAVGRREMRARLNDTKTAGAVRDALPLSSRASVWGDEVYFSIPVEAELEGGSETVSLGDIAYWPPGKALCLFLGPTPRSVGDEIRPASAVAVVGRVEGDKGAFRRFLSEVREGSEIRVSRAGPSRGV